MSEDTSEDIPRLGSTKNGSDMLRPTLFKESSEAPVNFNPFLFAVKKSFLSTKGLEVPVPRGSKSVNREAKSLLLGGTPPAL